MKNVPQHITVDIPKDGMGAKVGGAMSTRMPIAMTDESGNEIRGFFTKDEFVNANDLTYKRADSIPNAERYTAFLEAMHGYSKNIYEGFFNYLDTHDFTMNRTGHMKPADAAKRLKANFLELPGGYEHLRGFMRDELKLDQETIDAMAPAVDPKKVKNNRTAASFVGFLADVIGLAGVATKITNAHLGTQFQTFNTNINRRNNAMSDVADLLGSPDLIARSVDMTVVQDGKTAHGTYMLNAEGIIAADLNITNKATYGGANPPKTVIVEPETKRDLSRMQILDFLCGNIDRHAGNFTFKVDTSDPKTLRITGVLGIDNDASFGAMNFNSTDEVCYMSTLSELKVIDGTQAKAILDLTPDKLDARIRLAGLSAKEMNAAHERLAALQNRIRNNDIRIVRSMKEWEELDTEKLEVDTEIHANLFYFANSSIRTYFTPLATEEQKTFPKVKATAVNIQDDYSLQSYTQRLSELKKTAADNKLPAATTPAQEPYEKALEGTMQEIARLSKALAARANENQPEGTLPQRMNQAMLRQLSDTERNLLSMRLKDLQQKAEAYANANHTAPRDKADKSKQEALLNNAGNAAAYAAEARQQLQTISLEAERNLATKMARDIGGWKKPDYVPFVREPINASSYADLVQRLDTVDSGWISSSDSFKEMIEDLKALEGSESFTTEKARQLGFRKLVESTDTYLAYKQKQADDGKKLSKYAQQRIAYAKQIREYAQAHLAASKKAVADINQAGERVMDFIDRCKALQAASSAARSDEEHMECHRNILAFRDEYRKGCRMLMTIANSHPTDRPTQLTCTNNLLRGPVADFERLYDKAKKFTPDAPALFTAEEKTQNKQSVQQLDDRCKAFKQPNARNVVTRKTGRTR